MITIREGITALEKLANEHGDNTPIKTQILLQTSGINIVPIRRDIDAIDVINGVCILREK